MFSALGFKLWALRLALYALRLEPKKNGITTSYI
jgi:hypothetical protein